MATETASVPIGVPTTSSIVAHPYESAVGHQRNGMGLESRGDGSAGGGKHRVHFRFRKRQETPHHDRIKLRTARLNQTADCFFRGKPISIEARRNHGVENIDYRDDARYHRPPRCEIGGQAE